MEHNDTYTIYFGDAELRITSVKPSEHYHILDVEDGGAYLRAKIVKKVENSKYVAIITHDVKAMFEHLKSEFKFVEAAGGVVLNASGELLMIRLRGRWDLPKGHVEVGEESSCAALREVEEETGIRCRVVGDTPIVHTYHAYNTYGEWELKHTAWWSMQSVDGSLHAQDDEGITDVVWSKGSELNERLKTSYATICEVVERYLSIQ